MRYTNSPWRYRRITPCALLLSLYLAGSTFTAQAHEYWLDAVSHTWRTGQVFEADIRNGENFIGARFPFDNTSIQLGGVISNTRKHPLNGRLGDYPAIRFPIEEPGLHLLLLETTPRQISYASAKEFQAFLDYHGLSPESVSTIADAERPAAISERYYRYTKSLFHVNDNPLPSAHLSLIEAIRSEPSAAALATHGQRFEMSAKVLADPNHTLALTLTFDGIPLAQRQIEMFYRQSDTDEALRLTASTDASGTAEFSVAKRGDYLFNSVWITKPGIEDVDWETFWSSLTIHH